MDHRTTNDDQPLLLKPAEVARLLNLGRSTVFEMLAREELPAVRFGRAVRIPRRELEEFVRLRTQPAA